VIKEEEGRERKMVSLERGEGLAERVPRGGPPSIRDVGPGSRRGRKSDIEARRYEVGD